MLGRIRGRQQSAFRFTIIVTKTDIGHRSGAEPRMTSRRFVQYANFAFVVSIVCLGAGQSALRAQGRKERRNYEDQLARLFETLRAKDQLPPLARIVHRESLEELVCSAASLDSPVWGENRPGALMYRTSDPASLSSDLQDIARFRDTLQANDQPTFTRYAVAVWRSPNRESGQPVHWVGIQVFMSAFWEFIDSNFTDDRPYRNQWKDLVTPGCRGID
jgi:hypothetical protein